MSLNIAAIMMGRAPEAANRQPKTALSARPQPVVEDIQEPACDENDIHFEPHHQQNHGDNLNGNEAYEEYYGDGAHGEAIMAEETYTPTVEEVMNMIAYIGAKVDRVIEDNRDVIEQNRAEGYIVGSDGQSTRNSDEDDARNSDESQSPVGQAPPIEQPRAPIEQSQLVTEEKTELERRKEVVTVSKEIQTDIERRKEEERPVLAVSKAVTVSKETQTDTASKKTLTDDDLKSDNPLGSDTHSVRFDPGFDPVEEVNPNVVPRSERSRRSGGAGPGRGGEKGGTQTTYDYATSHGSTILNTVTHGANGPTTTAQVTTVNKTVNKKLNDELRNLQSELVSVCDDHLSKSYNYAIGAFVSTILLSHWTFALLFWMSSVLFSGEGMQFIHTGAQVISVVGLIFSNIVVMTGIQGERKWLLKERVGHCFGAGTEGEEDTLYEQDKEENDDIEKGRNVARREVREAAEETQHLVAPGDRSPLNSHRKAMRVQRQSSLNTYHWLGVGFAIFSIIFAGVQCATLMQGQSRESQNVVTITVVRVLLAGVMIALALTSRCWWDTFRKEEEELRAEIDEFLKENRDALKSRPEVGKSPEVNLNSVVVQTHGNGRNGNSNSRTANAAHSTGESHQRNGKSTEDSREDHTANSQDLKQTQKGLEKTQNEGQNEEKKAKTENLTKVVILSQTRDPSRSFDDDDVEDGKDFEESRADGGRIVDAVTTVISDVPQNQRWDGSRSVMFNAESSD